MESRKVFELSFLFSKKWPFFQTTTKTLVEYMNEWPPKHDYPPPYTLDSYNIQCQNDSMEQQRNTHNLSS